MKYIVIIVLAVSLCSCEGDAKESTQDGDFTIELLFEKDGCKMYRFNDGGRNIYWSDCRGKIQADYTVTTGKTTVRHRRETIND